MKTISLFATLLVAVALGATSVDANADKVQSKRAARLATCERKTRVVNAKLAILKTKIKTALSTADAAMPAEAATSTSTAATVKGETSMKFADVSDISVGDILTIGEGVKKETAEVESVVADQNRSRRAAATPGAVTFVAGLKNAHAKGTAIEWTAKAAAPTSAPTSAPTAEPTAAPTSAPTVSPTAAPAVVEKGTKGYTEGCDNHAECESAYCVGCCMNGGLSEEEKAAVFAAFANGGNGGN